MNLYRHGISKIVFVPYAAHDHNAYEEKVKTAFTKMGNTCSSLLFHLSIFNLSFENILGLEINSIHKSNDKLATVKGAQAFFVGGGNTFLLLKTLYDLNLLEAIKSRVLEVFLKYPYGIYME